MAIGAPINFMRWIKENRQFLKPPVGNKQIWLGDHDFFVNVIGGPNARTDYHIDEGEEFFYQLEGDITLRVVEDDRRRDIMIREGEIFLLPPRVPHSPQRPAGTLGLVIERRRLPHEKDGLVWYCENCGNQLHEICFYLTDFDLFHANVEKFYDNAEARACKKCGAVMARPHAGETQM